MKITIEKIDNGYVVKEYWGDKDSNKTNVIEESEYKEDDDLRAVRSLLWMITYIIDPAIKTDIKIKRGKHANWAKLDN